MLNTETMEDTHKPSHWLSESACIGKADIFFPDVPDIEGDNWDETKWEEWEIDSEPAAKEVCQQCKVKDECLEEASKDDGMLVGVFGGTNRWERAWLSANPKSAARLAAELKQAGIDPAELRAWVAAAGLPLDVTLERTVDLTAEKWGYPKSVVSRWYRVRNRRPPMRGVSEWSRVMRDYVADHPTQWLDQTDVLKMGVRHIPEKAVLRQMEIVKAKQGSCTYHSASSSIASKAVAAAVQAGIFEKRYCPERGCVQVRWARKQMSLILEDAAA